MLKIYNSIARELAKAFPSVPVYIQDIPQGFVRPSFFVDCTVDNTEELSKSLYKCNYTFQIVFFEETDAQGVVDREQQLKNYDKIHDLFNTGTLKIEGENRYAKIVNLSSNKREQDLYFNVELYLTDKRKEVNEHELMTTIKFRRY